MFKLTTHHSLNDLVITGEHPILCVCDNDNNASSDYILTQQMRAGLNKPQYVEAKHMNQNTFIAYKVPTFNVDNTRPTMNGVNCMDTCYII